MYLIKKHDNAQNAEQVLQGQWEGSELDKAFAAGLQI